MAKKDVKRIIIDFVLLLLFCHPFAIRLLSVCYPFAIPSFCYPFAIRSRFSPLHGRKATTDLRLKFFPLGNFLVVMIS